MNAQTARKFLKESGTKYVLAQFVDIHGSAKAKAVPAEHLDMVLTDGAGFAGFAVWGLGMGPQGPDFMAVGDASTLTNVPWMPGYARIVCDGHVKGKPYPYCSRVTLKKALADLAKQLARMVFNNALNAIFGNISFGGIKPPGAAHGGSFRVPGGSSGIDNKLAMLRVASGERIDIHKAGADNGPQGV